MKPQSVGAQLELGAGDTHGPLFGLKIFRNLTPRLYVFEKKKISTLFLQQCRRFSDFLSLLFQLCDRPVWTPVFIPRCASWDHDSARPSPRQKHYGIPAVALGYPVLHEHQHSQGHQEQPFHLRDAGQQPAVFLNRSISQLIFKLTDVCWGCAKMIFFSCCCC